MLAYLRFWVIFVPDADGRRGLYQRIPSVFPFVCHKQFPHNNILEKLGSSSIIDKFSVYFKMALMWVFFNFY